MVLFKITDDAKLQILRIFEHSGYTNPVARLCERADAGGLFDDIKDSIIHMTKRDEDITLKATKRFKEVKEQLKSILVIDVIEKSDCQREDLATINGINILMGDNVTRFLSGCCLVYDGRYFLLLDSDNEAHTLRSLAKKKKGLESE